MPLKAINKTLGQVSYSWLLDENNRGFDYVCPYCGEEMLVVLPEKNIIQHFRHKKGHAHKSESYAHLKGKQTIARYCMRNNILFELEYVDGNRIYDVYLPNLDLVFEIQCSNISFDEFDRRNRFDNTRGINTVWIWGGEYYEKTQAPTEFRKGKNGRYPLFYIPKIFSRDAGVFNTFETPYMDLSELKSLYKARIIDKEPVEGKLGEMQCGKEVYGVIGIKELDQVYAAVPQYLFYDFKANQFYLGFMNRKYARGCNRVFCDTLGWYDLKKVGISELFK